VVEVEAAEEKNTNNIMEGNPFTAEDDDAYAELFYGAAIANSSITHIESDALLPMEDDGDGDGDAVMPLDEEAGYRLSVDLTQVSDGHEQKEEKDVVEEKKDEKKTETPVVAALASSSFIPNSASYGAISAEDNLDKLNDTFVVGYPSVDNTSNHTTDGLAEPLPQKLRSSLRRSSSHSSFTGQGLSRTSSFRLYQNKLSDQSLTSRTMKGPAMKRSNSISSEAEFSTDGLRDDLSLAESSDENRYPMNTTNSVIDDSSMMITTALRDAVHFSFGVVAAEVYVANDRSAIVSPSPTTSPLLSSPRTRIRRLRAENSSIFSFFTNISESRSKLPNNLSVYKLFQPGGGWFVDPIYTTSSDDAADALRALQDPMHPEHVPPLPIFPGVGVAGLFWSENASKDEANAPWRDLRAVRRDPFQPPDKRMSLLTRAFGKAAGFAFDINGHKGIVLFYARSSAKDQDLSSEENLNYLRSSANLIGAISAWHHPRKRAILSRNKRKRNRESMLRRNASKLLLRAISFSSLNIEEKNAEKQTEVGTSIRDQIKACLLGVYLKVKVYSKKCAGAGLKPPPCAPTDQAMEAFIGSFLSLYVLSLADEFVRAKSNGKYNVILGPFGALIVLQFTLTSAPPSQPRNAVLGTLLGGIISVVINSVNENILPKYVAVALGPAIVTACMARIGIQHPPAGATAVVFILYNLGIVNVCLDCLFVLLAIFISTALNNLSETRQYPTNWGFESSFLLEYPGIFWKCVKKKKKSLSLTRMRQK